jgi:hypothetical protein
LSENRKIDVTPAMIAAGASALALYGWDSEDLEEAAVRIFDAMIKEIKTQEDQ